MASKMKSNLLTMSLSLLLISALASTLLSYVYKLTKDPIDLANKQKKIDALSMVIPEFDNSPLEETFKVKSDGDSLVCYIGKKGGEIIGFAVETYTNIGFSGYISVMVGFKPDGTIYNTVVLQHAETPGLGDKMDKEKSEWSNQFNDKNPSDFILKVKKDGGSVDAITAATISSRAYCDAVKRANTAFVDEIKPKY